jgi:PleD family two-component response regulator
VATVYPPDDTLDSMLKRADEALYRAKSRGRNQIDVERVDV